MIEVNKAGGRIKRTTLNAQPTHLELPQIGSIRIGEKAINKFGKEYPTALDYFKADSDTKDYADAFHLHFGDKPKKIPIIFTSNDINLICPNTLEIRDSAGKFVARGDGENFEVVGKADAQGKVANEFWDLKKIVEHPTYGSPEIFMQKAAAKYGTEWREVLRLKFMILGLNLFGHWQLTTFATKSSVPQITATIDAVLSSAQRLIGIPFDLCVKMVKSDKSGAKNKYPVLSLVCNLGQESLDLVKQVNPNTMLLTAANLQAQKLQITAAKNDNDATFDQHEEIK
jgi:hypothetical protein